MTQIVRVGEPAAMPTPGGVMVLIPRPDGSKRLYASRDMTGASLMTDGLDGDAGYNLAVRRMRNVLIINGPDYATCLRKMAEIWANQDREAQRVAALEAERKTRESLTMTRGEIEAGLELHGRVLDDGRIRVTGSGPRAQEMLSDDTALRRVARRLAEPTTAEKMLAAEYAGEGPWRTRTGKELTAAEVEGYATEAEAGYGVVEGKIVPGRPTTVDEHLEGFARLKAAARGHIALDPAEVGEDGRYVGVCSCDWRGQLLRSSEAGANADTLDHLIEEEARAGELGNEEVAERVLRPAEPSGLPMFVIEDDRMPPDVIAIVSGEDTAVIRTEDGKEGPDE